MKKNRKNSHPKIYVCLIQRISNSKKKTDIYFFYEFENMINHWTVTTYKSLDCDHIYIYINIYIYEKKNRKIHTLKYMFVKSRLQ